MESKLSRRKFGQIGLAALASALVPLAYASNPAYAGETASSNSSNPPDSYSTSSNE